MKNFTNYPANKTLNRSPMMKKKDVKIGEHYVAKVSGKLTTVKILRESTHGGWDAENTGTGRSIRVRTAGRLRGPSATPVGFPYRKPFDNEAFAHNLATGCQQDENAVRKMFQESKAASSDPVVPKSIKELF